MTTHRSIARSFALAMLGAAALLSGCGSAPTVRYHSLMPATAAAPPPASASWAIDAVTIPAQVDQPQWLVRMSDDSMRLLEQERWAGPLADELRGALAEAIARRIGSPVSTRAGTGKSWRVRVDVQRLELAPTRHAALVVDWSVGSGGGRPRTALPRRAAADGEPRLRRIGGCAASSWMVADARSGTCGSR